jgi:hypothetical protein
MSVKFGPAHTEERHRLRVLENRVLKKILGPNKGA